jgi:hypothetical protein
VGGSFKVDKNGNPMKDGGGHAKSTTIWGIENEVNNEIWIESIDSLLHEKEPIFHQMLFLDAIFYHYTNDIKLTLFHLAITCEQALDYYTFKKWEDLKKDKIYKKTRVFKGDNFISHIDKQSLKFFKHSYRIDHPSSFDLISLLWRARNNIAHGGHLNVVMNGKVICIDKDLSKRIIKAVQDYLYWLGSLV